MIFPYLELPVAIGYGEGQEEKIVTGKFQPVKISGYHAGYYDVGVFIYIEGQPIQVALTVEELEKQLTGYWSMVNGKQSIRQKLKMVE